MTVAYIRIVVHDLKQAQQFYKALGLVPAKSRAVSPHNDESRRCLLQSPAHWCLSQPYILLEEAQTHEKKIDSNNKTLHAAEHVGIARMCLIVKNVPHLVAELEKKYGIQPMAPPIEGRLPNSTDEIDVAAYRDMSGSNNVVELLSFKKQNYLLSCASRIVTLFPLVLHVNINVSDYPKSLNAYQNLGFQLSQDYGRCGDGNLHKALAVPDPGIAAHVSLLKMRGDKLFIVELMEWEDPTTTITTAYCANMINAPNVPKVSIAIWVPSVSNVLEKLLPPTREMNDKLDNKQLMQKTDSGETAPPPWRLLQGPEQIELPSPLGFVTRATILDRNEMPIELVSYP